MNSHSHETTALTPQDVELPWPTGFAGELAHFIYHNSYMPVKEVAITATLALLAGVCGRAYLTHTSKDLALYIILVARSGIGKDGIHEGIPKLIQLAGVPGAERFIRRLTTHLAVTDEHVAPGFEDVYYYLWKEGTLPVNVDPFKRN